MMLGGIFRLLSLNAHDILFDRLRYLSVTGLYCKAVIARNFKYSQNMYFEILVRFAGNHFEITLVLFAKYCGFIDY